MAVVRIAGGLALAWALCVPMDASAAQWQIDFDVRVDSLVESGDVSLLGDPLAGLTVNDTVSGSFTVEVPQADQSALANQGRFEFGNLSLVLPSGPKPSLGLDGRVGFEEFGDATVGTFDQELSAFFLSASIRVDELDFGDGSIRFFEVIGINEGVANPVFTDVNVVDPGEIAANLVGMNYSYRDSRRVGAINAKGALVTQDLDSADLQGVITSASANLVPEPATGLLFLSGVALFARRRVARS